VLRYFLFLVFFAYGYADVELLPVNEKGRFRPLEVMEEKGDFAELKMIPSRRHPDVWLPLNQFQNASNPSLFTDKDWAELKTLYLSGDKDVFGGLCAVNGEELSVIKNVVVEFSHCGAAEGRSLVQQVAANELCDYWLSWSHFIFLSCRGVS
jgi:hypothetical protein